MSRRPSLHNPFQQTIVPEIFSDSRSHGPQGPPRHVRIPQTASVGGGAICKNEDGTRCVVAGRESLRILRISEPNAAHSTDHKCSTGPGGHRIDASRNLWAGSGLKVDSVSTDVIWGHGLFNAKILTSARNGELIMWDLNKSGSSKYERRTRQHVRAVHMLAYSPTLQNYCLTGSADGDMRVWDLRDLRDSILKIHHPGSLRSVILSPVHWQPRHAVAGSDNGNIYRWDLNMGQRGQLDRIPLAHTGPILAMDWHHPASFAAGNRSSGTSVSPQSGNWYSNVGSGLFDDLGAYGNVSPVTDVGESTGMGWLATGGMDRTVKVWDLSAPTAEAHISRKPKYTLHTSFPVRSVSWRPHYECEIAVGSYLDHSSSTQSSSSFEHIPGTAPGSPRLGFSTSPTEHRGGNGGKTHSKMGDPLEIWDVRRGYVAKWTLRGSAVEGGITDMTFADSHSVWAQHFSGAFSQFDVRYSTKMIDSIPRSSLAWDAAGSLMFVADRTKRWEVPYDDVNPEKRPNVKRKLKALGDKPYFPASQTICMVTGHELSVEPETIVKLAQGYLFEGEDRSSICKHNAEVAYQAERPDAAQTWLFISSLLTDIVPVETPAAPPTLSPLPFSNPRLPHSTSAPAAIPTVSHPISNHPMRSLSEDAQPERTSPVPQPSNLSATSSKHGGHKGRTYSSSTFSLNSDKDMLSPLRTTPASSTTPSPHRPTTPLPTVSSSVTGSMLNRRSSNIGTTPSSARLGTSYRRPSFNVQSLLGTEPEVRNQPHSSLRHVGEGALDDSDSEGSDTGAAVANAEASVEPMSDDEQLAKDDPDDSNVDKSSALRVGSTPYWNSRSTSVQPSPLSRVAGQQTWTEDEKEEDDSPSPASTDSDSDESARDLPPFRPMSRRNSTRRSSTRSTRNKTRSRSSTVASLAVSTTPSPLARQPSHGSVRTITPTPTPTSARGFEREATQKPPAQHVSSLKQEDAVRSVSGPSKYPASISSAHRLPETASVRSTSFHSLSRPRSDVFENDGDPDASRELNVSRAATLSRNRTKVDLRHDENMKRSEARLRETAWEALKETLEVYADEGDVQMCAMLSLVAPTELSISTRRVVRFVESYVELLMRMRLHTVAAYVRKHAPAEDIKQPTEIQTTLYTLCGKCRKPILQPISHGDGVMPYGNYAYCKGCKSSITKCSICRLPVRALLFQCTVCNHGGHEECYQKYYLHRPPVPMKDNITNRSPTQARPFAAEPRLRRAQSKSVDDDGSDDGREPEEGNGTIREVVVQDGKQAIAGHPCAAGCGHYCWATNERTSVDSP